MCRRQAKLCGCVATAGKAQKTGATADAARGSKRRALYARYGSPHTGVTNHGSNPIDWNEDVTRADNVNC
jgi:hypothetical protein